MYAPTKEQAEADRDAAFAAGVPFGSAVAHPTKHGSADGGGGDGNSSGRPPLRLRVVSELQSAEEGFREVNLVLSPEMTVEAARLAVRDATGVPPALCRLSFAGRRLEDARRTLGQYGLAFWHGKFPGWPLVITRC
jgi:hypothetical protein